MRDAAEQHNGKASLANDRGVIVPSQCKVIHLKFSRRHQSYRSIEISPLADEYSSFIRKTWPMNMRDAADLIKLPYRPLKNLCVKMIRRKEKRIFHISSPSSLWRILDFYLESNFRNRSRDRSLMPSCPSSLILPPQCLISLPKNLCVKMIRRKKEYTSPSSSWRIDFGLTFISNQIFENKR